MTPANSARTLTAAQNDHGALVAFDTASMAEWAEAVFEELADGARHVWGTITVWEPPGRVVFTWHPGRKPDTAQDVEVRFIPLGQGNRLGAAPHGVGAAGRGREEGALPAIL